MKIHVVCGDTESGSILARLAALFKEHPAFTVSSAIDPGADINYFFPYLEYEDQVVKTKTAAWFTHRDDGREFKIDRWYTTSEAVDLRLTSAKLYAKLLQQDGQTAVVTPPLDRNHFVPVPKQTARSRRLVGTSGFVYTGGRKGETLLAQLMIHQISADFVASGKGWPCRTAYHEWQNMPAFYQNLDVYVCTSEIEGIGYGPLEAMACGIPVVVPRGVGIFDELPDLENLHRYQAGNLASLSAAVDVAFSRLDENALNVESLRSATARFTAEAWIDTHLRAFEALLYDTPIEHPHPGLAGKSGVYYVAFGEPARECAMRAIQSFKEHMPDVEVAIVSSEPLGAGEDFFIQHSDDDIGARSVKTMIYDLAPAHWEYVLYLDADTEVVADISFLYHVLDDGWDATFCINPSKYVLTKSMSRPDNSEEVAETFNVMGGDEMLQLNGGVFGFRRSERTAAFFRAWHTEWQRYGKRDQAALDRVLYRNPIRVYVLGNEWNTITRYLPAERTAGILHYPMSARRWRGRIDGRLDSSEAWGAVHPGGKQ